MFVPKKNQKVFLNFIEVLRFFNEVNKDVVVSNKAPNSALFSQEKGIIAGCNFSHLCSLVEQTFGIKLISSGCLESPFGYILTFEDGYLDSLEKAIEPVVQSVQEVKEPNQVKDIKELVVEDKPKRKNSYKKS